MLKTAKKGRKGVQKIKLHPLYFIALLLAGIINATGVALFLAPLKLFDSGISGTAFLLDVVPPPYLVLSLFLIVLNVPFFLLGMELEPSAFMAVGDVSETVGGAGTRFSLRKKKK